ncbi:hypothetical protein [Pseudogracilibacillus sp. SO30301A]|uniref:hypothetical protein n=1 Tax=Pseudogracilibacillus sp. SO30301A TaxID=3098291 RepID=UPI00300DD7CB
MINLGSRYIIKNETRYIELSEYDIDEYRMMERICFTLSDPGKVEELLVAINGRGIFRRFKDVIHKLGLPTSGMIIGMRPINRLPEIFATRMRLNM